MKISDIEGIGPAYEKKLVKAGIRSTDALLKRGATLKGRKEVAVSAGVSHSQVLEWVNRADLYRIKGVGSQFSDLLEKSGVDSVVELSKRLPDNLYKKMQDVNKAKNLVNAMPGLKKVKGWISQAKKMKRVVTY
jgi:predicted flap endonuclease-1-like 5' DNA nuclease